MYHFPSAVVDKDCSTVLWTVVTPHMSLKLCCSYNNSYPQNCMHGNCQNSQQYRKYSPHKHMVLHFPHLVLNLTWLAYLYPVSFFSKNPLLLIHIFCLLNNRIALRWFRDGLINISKPSGSPSGSLWKEQVNRNAALGFMFSNDEDVGPVGITPQLRFRINP